MKLKQRFLQLIIQNIRQMRPKARNLVLQDVTNCQNNTSISPPSLPHPPKTNLKNIIEVTEEQETYPSGVDSPKEQPHQPLPPFSKLAQIKSYFMCLTNCWRYFFQTPTRIELDVDDSDFAAIINRIRSQKSYYAAVLPPQKQKRKVLVLDLDETLIHTTFNKPAKYDYESEVMFNGKSTKIYTAKRFGLESFLFQMSRLFEIVVFTASQKLYADKVLDLIDPKKRISHRLYREHCIVINKTYYLKNLKILGRDLSHTIIVDDNNIAGLLHPDNFYRIDQFDGHQKDRQLCRLSAFLKYLHPRTDILPVREHRKRFEEIEINLEEADIGPVKQAKSGSAIPEERSLNQRKKQYKHKKTNSEIQALVAASDGNPNDEAQTTAGELIKRL